jgi:hypothetical protein
MTSHLTYMCDTCGAIRDPSNDDVRYGAPVDWLTLSAVFDGVYENDRHYCKVCQPAILARFHWEREEEEKTEGINP